MYPQVQKAKEMLIFLVHNPEKFACDSLLWPSIIVIIKVVTAIGAQLCCVLNLLYVNDELKAIKAYAIVTILASVDSKMLMMISNIEVDGSMAD
jgi:hypothetical protein